LRTSLVLTYSYLLLFWGGQINLTSY
jgi:hypothetical protein